VRPSGASWHRGDRPGIGLVGGTVLWGYGVWWLLFAMPFNLGWRGFTFPLGVYAVATLTLARQTHLDFLLAIGTGLVACLAAFWVTIATRVARCLAPLSVLFALPGARLDPQRF
jgi:tellurite resistance protein TehA-like permease